MPFLRVIRDKRGYETTYLMDWRREGERQRSYILYVFRTPGSARVGREALGPEARREVEARYPYITFDWPAVLKSQQIIDVAPEIRRRKKRRDDEERPAPTASAPPIQQPAGAPAFPSVIEGASPDERIAFLTTWYPLARERVLSRRYDAAREEALLKLADRLNPALWSDADQITSGLQLAAEALDRLARVFGKRRRRSRRPSAKITAPAGASDAPAVPSAPTEPPSSDS